MPDRPDEPATGGSGHPDRDRLRRWLDEALSADEAADVQAHVEGCTHCQQALEETEPPVRLAAPPDAAGWDERRMRRAVRRALLRTAFDVLSIVVVLALVATALGAFVVSPLLVDRGDRVERARTAVTDLPILLTPGATPTSQGQAVGLASQRHETSFVRYIGSQGRDLGTFSGRLGILNWQPDPPSGYMGQLGLAAERPRPFEPHRLPDGTVASVQLSFADGIDLTAADALAADHEEVSLQWVGFHVDVVRTDDVDAPWLAESGVGYSACHQGWDPERSGGRVQPGGSEHALDQARRATANLAASRDLRRALEGSVLPALRQIDEVADWLADNEPPVGAVVLTGPTADLAAIVDEAAPDEATQLGVDLYNGPGSMCG
jgi:hypothetical protein